MMPAIFRELEAGDSVTFYANAPYSHHWQGEIVLAFGPVFGTDVVKEVSVKWRWTGPGVASSRPPESFKAMDDLVAWLKPVGRP